MYFPYLRGRQSELLALRELVARGLLSDNVIPVIEPIKLLPALNSTLLQFINSSKEIAIIHNPKVPRGADFNYEVSQASANRRQEYQNLIQNPLVIPSHIICADSQREIQQVNAPKSNLLVVHKNLAHARLFEQVFHSEQPRYVLLPSSPRFSNSISAPKVVIDDKFNKQRRNVDYLDEINEFFSEDHLSYQDEDYIGFSDYSIVGEEFVEGGTSPYAIAIHIVYLGENDSLNIMHFVSDTNNNQSNPANKYYEAVSKLHEWVNHYSISPTLGLQNYLDSYNNGTYPGLPSLKKWSIMHHLELMGRFLDSAS